MKKSAVVPVVTILIFSLVLVSTSQAALTALSSPDITVQAGYRYSQQRQDLILALEAYSEAEYVYAYRMLVPLARTDVAVAQYYLATLYDQGKGTDQDQLMAFIWYKRAALQGHTEAQHNLAVAYARGVTGKPDMKKAINWWKRAASMGNTDSQFNLGVIYSGGYGAADVDMSQALHWWRVAARNGDVAAQFNLGAIYANGLDGQSSRLCEASRWWKKAADSGFKRAETALRFIQVQAGYTHCP